MSVTVPDWADTLLDLIGVAWPNVDEDAYREMADSLREFADDLLDDGQLANNHVERLLSASKGESIEALNQHWNKVKGRHFKDIASAARTIAGAMDLAAGAVVGMKTAALVQLGYLASEAGIALSLIPVTGGLSMLIGAGAMRATQEVIKRLIKECVEEAVGYIVSAMTEPAVAALEGMAADLVVQLGSMALGLQDGVDLDQAKTAGKDGFHDGVQSGKESLHLASAGAGGGTGGGTGLVDLHIEHSEHTRAGTNLTHVSTGIHGKTTAKLAKAKHHHGRTRGRDSIAQAIDPVADKAMAALTKATKAMGDHVGKTLPKAVKQISTDHKKNDQAIHDDFNRLKKNGGDGSGKADRSAGNGGASSRTRPDALHGAKDEPRRNAISLDKKRCENDPIDVVTGEMTLPQTDLALPGTLPLVLRRTHLSGYRYGKWFGRSWASTLDERLEPDPVGFGAVWAREDGSLLVYPRLPRTGDEPVLPLEGPRLALAHAGDDGGETTYTVTDDRTGLKRSFTGSPYRASTAYWLTAIEDRNANAITFARAADGAPTGVTHSGGYTVDVATGDQRVAELAVRAADGPVPVMSYGYDEPGNLTALTNSSGLPQLLTYDEHARVTSWTDRNNSTFRYVYDTAGRVVRTIGPDGFLSSTFDYDTAAGTTRYTDSTGATTVFRFNDHLQVISETDPLGHTVSRLWDPYDRLLAHTDPQGRTTTYTYDGSGDLVGIVHPDGSAVTVAYNDRHQLTAVSTPDGATSRQEYDERGNPTLFTRPNGTTTRLFHDAQGHLTGVDDSLDGPERIHCDPAGLPLAIRTAQGGVTRYVRDAFGRPTLITDPHGRATELEWTVEGKLARRADPGGSTQAWTYDGEGNCLTHTDAAGGQSRFEYTHFDLIAARTTPEGARHSFAYDTELRLTLVTNPSGQTWSYTYDAVGRRTSETDFDGRSLHYTHDLSGRLTSRTNGLGQTIRYERDSAGRVVVKDAGGALTHFTYDDSGRLTRAVSPDAELTYVRDASGRVLRELCNGRQLVHTHDEAGRRTRRVTPTGAVSTWAFPGDRSARLDASGRQVTFRFDESGRETTRRIGEALTIDHAYDEQGRLTGQLIRAADDRTVQERSYTYRPDGHLTEVGDRLTGRRRFDLTPGGRVTGVSAAQWTERYAYDAAGNQTEAVWPADDDSATGARSYAGTRLTQAGSVRYEHDVQGRVVLRQKQRLSRKPDTWRYEWDVEDRLVAVTTPDGTRWRYLYDALGRRIAKQRLAADGTSVAEEVSFTWDGDVLVEQVTRTPGSPESVALTWDHDGMTPVTQVERRFLGRSEVDSRFFAIATDLIGTPRELVDEQGEVAWYTRATLWGSTTWNRDAGAYTPLRFPGQYFDPESGLHYNRHRHYDPSSGRYVSPDPLGLAPAPNAFAYVDNPTRWTDPLGLAMCPHRQNGEHRHSVVLGVDVAPQHASETLARYLRNDPGDPDYHDPTRPRDPGAHTYNGPAYAGQEAGGPVWMTNVMDAIGDRGTTLSITLDGMPNSSGHVGNWNTPEDIVDAFQTAARHGAPFNTLHEDNYPRRGDGTAWEMSRVAAAVTQYDGAAAWGDPDHERPGRPWEEIHWYSENQRIHVPKPDIPEIQPDLSNLPKKR
ncbi:type IV secretion protein Rhs [Streptomyces sp. CB00455]|uniref:RHS repeat-associated core domain-containing protein n=1 Tax=Streptomyces sp. CB00455 TaxID=1703927 RepID=UPI00093C8EA1|nr:RHS repeat-associated core domain-containing protein [Streptomyces sp. CB00455]OKK16831.1 type IV secretion protein Rhs [Streptomyces sp. CB00455]